MGSLFKSAIIEVFKNHAKPKEKQWMKLSITFSVKDHKQKKRERKCTGKWERGDSHTVKKNGSINPSFQNEVPRCLRPKGGHKSG